MGRASKDSNAVSTLIVPSSTSATTLLEPTATPIAGVNPLNVSVVDASGTQITSFGGGTQYTDGGTPPANPVGNTIEWNEGGTWQTVSTAKPLPVTASIDTTGLATSAKQDTGNTSLSSIDGKITAVNTGAVTISAALPAGTNVIGKTGIDQTTPGTTNLVALTAETTKVIGTVRMASGGVASGSYASGSIASGAVASGAFASGSVSDGAVVTLGAKTDAKSTATDATSVTVMQVLKQISASVQAPPSQAVTNAGTFAVQSTNQANSGVDIGDVTINNASGGSAVNIQDGGNSITVDGSVTANPTAKTILSKTGSASTSGNNTLVSAGSNKLKVFAFSLSTSSTTAITCKFQDGAGGTDLWSVILQAPTSVSTGANLAVSPPAWLFNTSSATLLNLNLSSANAVQWSVSYFDEA